MKSILRFSLVLIVFSSLLGFIAQPAVQDVARAEGADLSFSPDGGSFVVGRTFNVKVALNSGGGVGVNAADGTVNFDPAMLSVSAVSKDGSVFSLWTSEPSYSNSNGSVTFSGGSPSAYTKSGGSIISITFKALKAGETSVSFSSASVLAADGKGTNVLSGTKKANFTLTGSAPAPEPKVETPAPEPEATPSAGSDLTAEVSSPTHPDPEKWYSSNTPEFKWKLSPDVGGLSATLTKNSTDAPPKVTEGIIDSKRFDRVEDGVWYLHLRLKGQGSSWSNPIHRKAMVDATPPEVFTVDLKQEDKGLPPIAMISASDKTSGLDYYEVKVNDGETTRIAIDQLKEGGYKLPPVLPGKHKVLLKAFDRAGNATEAIRDFEIEGTSKVRIISSPGTMEEREYLIVEGDADKYAKVYLKIETEGKAISEEALFADEAGKWVYAYRKLLKPADYELSARMITRAGAESSPSEKVGLKVVPAPFLEKYALIIVLLLMFALIAVVILLWYERKEYLKRKEMLMRETEDIRHKTEAVFAALNEEAEEKITLLDEERAAKLGIEKMEPDDVLDRLRDALDISQDTLTKEIDDVEKVLDN